MADENPMFHGYCSERLDWRNKAAPPFQQATLREVENVGHWPHHDQLVECVGLIGDFLVVALR